MAVNNHILYNLVQWIRDNLPNETIYPNSRFVLNSKVSARNAVIRETGGGEVEVMTNHTYQIMARATNPVDARELAYTIYELLQSTAGINGRFGQLLPSATVGVNTYPAVKVARITAIQRPESLGEDGNGNNVFTMNFQVFL